MSKCRLLLRQIVFSVLLTAAAFPLATAVLAQQSAPPAVSTKDFVGTWHWMFQGKPFVTMILEPKADGVTGSVTNASLHADAEGRITEAYAGSGTCPIIRSSLENGVLHIVCKDDSEEIEWAVKLTSPATAEIAPVGMGGPRLEPIRAEKAP